MTPECSELAGQVEEGKRACLDEIDRGTNGRTPAAGSWAVPFRAVRALGWGPSLAVAENPWILVGVVALSAFVVGAAVARARRRRKGRQ